MWVSLHRRSPLTVQSSKRFVSMRSVLCGHGRGGGWQWLEGDLKIKKKTNYPKLQPWAVNQLVDCPLWLGLLREPVRFCCYLQRSGTVIKSGSAVLQAW